jgi:4'-phosphopantetheinyl transferase
MGAWTVTAAAGAAGGGVIRDSCIRAHHSWMAGAAPMVKTWPSRSSPLLPGARWTPPPARVELTAHEVHVWYVSLAQPATRVQRLAQLLAPEESQRAASYVFARDSDRFVVGRGALRVILGRYLGCDPAALAFTNNPFGKPGLVPSAEGTDVQFNVAHSGDTCLIAATVQRRVGVDVEVLHHDIDCLRLARHCFSPYEVRVLTGLPPVLQYIAFYTGWTRKEAFIKARGEGLSLPLDQFDVTLAPGEPPRLLATRYDTEDAARWSLATLTPGPGLIGALAVEGEGWQLRRWQVDAL